MSPSHRRAGRGAQGCAAGGATCATWDHRRTGLSQPAGARCRSLAGHAWRNGPVPLRRFPRIAVARLAIPKAALAFLPCGEGEPPRRHSSTKRLSCRCSSTPVPRSSRHKPRAAPCARDHDKHGEDGGPSRGIFAAGRRQIGGLADHSRRARRATVLCGEVNPNVPCRRRSEHPRRAALAPRCEELDAASDPGEVGSIARGKASRRRSFSGVRAHQLGPPAGQEAGNLYPALVSVPNEDECSRRRESA